LGVLRALTVTDAGVVVLAFLVSLVAFDLVPGPTVLLAVVVGGAAWFEIRRAHPAARRLVETFGGMLFALAVVLVLAFVVH